MGTINATRNTRPIYRGFLEEYVFKLKDNQFENSVDKNTATNKSDGKKTFERIW